MAVFRNANGRTCAHVSSSSLGAQIHRHILVIDTFWRCIGCWANSLTSFPEWTPYRPPSVPFLEEPVCARHNRELRVLHTLGSTWRSTYYSLIPVFRFAGDRFSRHRRNVQSMQQPQLILRGRTHISVTVNIAKGCNWLHSEQQYRCTEKSVGCVWVQKCRGFALHLKRNPIEKC